MMDTKYNVFVFLIFFWLLFSGFSQILDHQLGYDFRFDKFEITNDMINNIPEDESSMINIPFLKQITNFSTDIGNSLLFMFDIMTFQIPGIPTVVTLIVDGLAFLTLFLLLLVIRGD